MFSNAKRKEERMNSGLPDFITTNTYNIIIGAVVLYGFIVNALMIAFCGDVFAGMNPIALLVGYFILCLLGVFITRSNNPIASFIGYNFVVVPIGALLSVCLPMFDPSDILAAFVVTGIVVVIMIAVSASFPKLFARMGTALFIALLVSFVSELIATWLGYGGDIFNWIFVVLFSLYIGYDWHKAQVYPKTIDNAVDSALDIYLDIINLFIRLLEIFSKSDD